MKQLDRRFLGWGKFPGGSSELEVRQFFTLSPDELQAVRLRRRPLNRLGVALQIGHMRLTGTPMNSVQMIPPEVLAFISDQVGIPAPRLASIRALYRRRRTLFEHQTAAKQALGLRGLSEYAERSLNGALRREAGERHAVADLVTAARDGLPIIITCSSLRAGLKAWPLLLVDITMLSFSRRSSARSGPSRSRLGPSDSSKHSAAANRGWIGCGTGQPRASREAWRIMSLRSRS